jgi:formylglycine-generating enzyme
VSRVRVKSRIFRLELVLWGVLVGAIAAIVTLPRGPVALLRRLPKFPAVMPAPRPPVFEIQKPLAPIEDDKEPTTLAEQRARLLERVQVEHGLSSEQLAKVRTILERSPFLGQGNPTVSKHPLTRRRCREIRAQAGNLAPPNPACGSAYMVSITEPGDAAAAKNRVCIDQYEFPNIPCEYPVVHVSAREAVLLCEAVGKRICDAHEWEGACAGAVLPSDVEYAWKAQRPLATHLHNVKRVHTWAYGSAKNHLLCAMASFKTPGCEGGGYRHCGSNTYPAGSFPQCVSLFGVYDQHGNVAEHMNLPLAPDELASAGGHGFTEMKGSWFIFRDAEVHADDCRWRAPDWHGSRMMDGNSHANYHLGFRCCRSVTGNN